MFNFHPFDNLSFPGKKIDPRSNINHIAGLSVLPPLPLLFAAKVGDISAFKRFYLKGMDMQKADFDGRTALHIAAAEGHFELVKYLVETVKVNPQPKDRWNSTPFCDALKSNNLDIIEYLRMFCCL